MARSQARSKRKASGGRYRKIVGKIKSELARPTSQTKLAERKGKTLRIKGGNIKKLLLSADEINITDKKGKTQKTKILNVLENPANPNLVRRNIITKGAIVETKLGKVKITSRPGQEGNLSGIMI